MIEDQVLKAPGGTLSKPFLGPVIGAVPVEPGTACPQGLDEKASLAGPQRAGRGHGGNSKPHLVTPFHSIHETLLSDWNAEGKG